MLQRGLLSIADLLVPLTNVIWQDVILRQTLSKMHSVTLGKDWNPFSAGLHPKPHNIHQTPQSVGEGNPLPISYPAPRRLPRLGALNRLHTPTFASSCASWICPWWTEASPSIFFRRHLWARLLHPPRNSAANLYHTIAITPWPIEIRMVKF